MEKIIVKEALYENIRTHVGEIEREVWVTSDGIRFYTEDEATSHEFYSLKVKKRQYGVNNVQIFNCDSWEDIQKYIDDYGYNINVHDYDKELLEFPNTYVLSEEEVYDEDIEDFDYEGLYSNSETYLRIYTLQEFKNKINKELDLLDI